MKTVLICHEEDPLNRSVMARWLASFTELAAVISIEEPPGRMRQRIRREIKRIGLFRFVDVLAFRLYYRLFLADRDAEWKAEAVAKYEARYPALPESCVILKTPGPNSPEAEALLQQIAPDFALARCKALLNKRIFTIPKVATLVLHPGVCPEYRNAHGCFWALSKRDLKRVGMTLLKIDEGVDTGPVFGYYSYAFDERTESHIVIQERVVLENLAELEQKFAAIYEGRAEKIDTSGRASAVWGQPWLTAYLRWKRAAK